MTPSAIGIFVACGALVAALAVGIGLLLKRSRRSDRLIAVDERRAEQIGRLVAAQRGPAESAAARLRDQLHDS